MSAKISILGVELYTYSLFMFLAFFSSSIVLKILFSRRNINPKYYLYISIISLCLGILGAKLFSFFETTSFYDFNLENFIKSGKNFFGGILVLIPFVFLLSIVLKINYSTLFACLSISTSLAYSIGRLGCFFSGDGCYGIVTNSCLGMSFPNGIHPTINNVYPTPLFESIISFLIFIILLFVEFKSNNKEKNLIIFCIFMLLIGTERFFMEFIRNNMVYLWGLTQAQVISLIMILIAIVVWITIIIKSKSNFTSSSPY